MCLNCFNICIIITVKGRINNYAEVVNKICQNYIILSQLIFKITCYTTERCHQILLTIYLNLFTKHFKIDFGILLLHMTTNVIVTKILKIENVFFLLLFTCKKHFKVILLWRKYF